MAFEPDRYIGKQLIFNSNGRILLNAEEDQTLWSNKGFLFSTNGEFHFNTSTQKDSKFVVNSPKIQLGIDPGSTTTVNPAVTQAAQGRITSLKQRLKEIKSEKVFLT